MAVGVFRRNARVLLRPRASVRARPRAFTASRPGLSFSITGDVTVVLSVGGVTGYAVSGGSSGRARVRPANGPQFFVRPRR